MATTFKVCRDLAHAVELYEAGLLTVDMDTSYDRTRTEYVDGFTVISSAADLTQAYTTLSGWRARDFGYLGED